VIESKQEQLSLLDISTEPVVANVPSPRSATGQGEPPSPQRCSPSDPTKGSIRRPRRSKRISCPDCGGELAGELVDNAAIRRWLGVTEAAADAMMRRVPKVNLPDLRKVYVRRRELERLIDENTHAA